MIALSSKFHALAIVKSQRAPKIPTSNLRCDAMQSNGEKLMERVQAMLRRLDARALQRLGMRFLPIDNNPRHGLLTLGPSGAIEVIHRVGQWWVMPQRR